jgi:hypothetical protein
MFAFGARMPDATTADANAFVTVGVGAGVAGGGICRAERFKP